MKPRRKKSPSSSSSVVSPLSQLIGGSVVQQQIVAALLILLTLFTLVAFGAVFRIPSLDAAAPQDSSAHKLLPFLQKQHPGLKALEKKLALEQERHQKEELQFPNNNKDTTNAAGDNSKKDALYRVQHTFPVMVGEDDMEEIVHPGVAYSISPNPQLPRTISVPKFWDSTEAYGPGGVRGFLGNHGQDLMTPQQAASVGSYVPARDDPNNLLETIYVSVASYRDPECLPTIESILERARYPERIRVAVIDQRSTATTTGQQQPQQQDNDEQYFCRPKSCGSQQESVVCQSNVDYYTLDARLSVGPVFARHLAHRMFRGEYFAMQVDSHVRFTQDWDVDLVAQWKSAQNEMCVLTTYLSDIIGSIDPVTHQSIHNGRPIMCKSDYEGSGKLKHLRHGQQPEGPAGIHGQPTLQPFWAAGFSFARAHFVTQVPYDQYLPMVFQGEEISMGLRGFTYGYDYYTAERAVCFHMYAIKENSAKRHKVKLFWENAPRYTGVELKAMKRLNAIIGMTTDDPDYDHSEQDKYGLGQVRQPDQFFETFGIHRDTQTVEQNLCTFVGKPMMKEFKPHLRTNRMGINYDEIHYRFVDPRPPKRGPRL